MGGEACDDDIEALIEVTSFSDIFDTAVADPSTGACPRTFSGINAQGGAECLRLKAGMQLAASRLEYRRCAASSGNHSENRHCTFC